MARSKRAYNKRKARITLAAPQGDHGPKTVLQSNGTVLERVEDDKNNMHVKKRVNQVDFLHRQSIKKISLRQYCAAKVIQEAHERVEMLSSGGELKAKVDTSPKPDACVAVQIDAISRFTEVMKPIQNEMRDIVEHVCCHNQPISSFSKRPDRAAWSDLCIALDLVANKM